MRPWDETYPDPARLRLETDAMRQAVLEALLARLGPDAFVGIYAKGSTVKPWDGPLDYVPELSDLDIQLVLHDPDLLDDLGLALGIQADFEARFFARIADPVHLPRPQIQVINRSLGSPTFSPSPAGVVLTLHGAPYAQVHPFAGQESVRQADLSGLVQRTTAEEIRGFALKFMDMPGKYLFLVLRQISWRVGPVGPRVLSALGAGFEAAWGHNRTGVCARLAEFGQAELARGYAAFYLSAWDYFRSAYQNTDAAREAVLAGVGVLRSGLSIGRSLSVPPTSL